MMVIEKNFHASRRVVADARGSGPWLGHPNRKHGGAVLSFHRPALAGNLVGWCWTP
jgi:hypothetical protein